MTFILTRSCSTSNHFRFKWHDETLSVARIVIHRHFLIVSRIFYSVELTYFKPLTSSIVSYSFFFLFHAAWLVQVLECAITTQNRQHLHCRRLPRHESRMCGVACMSKLTFINWTNKHFVTAWHCLVLLMMLNVSSWLQPHNVPRFVIWSRRQV